MDRRNFLRTLVGGVVGAAALRTWPFRVYSFPSEIQIQIQPAFTREMLRRAVSMLHDRGTPPEIIMHPAQYQAYKEIARIGSGQVLIPQHQFEFHGIPVYESPHAHQTFLISRKYLKDVWATTPGK